MVVFVTTDEEWRSAWTSLVGQEVARVRRQQGMSAQALAEACTELGVPMQRGSITKLENGHRKGVDVHDVVAIATALGVAPAELLFPGAQDDAEIEYLPGETIPAARAWNLFHGDDSPATVRLHQAHHHVSRANELLGLLAEEQREKQARKGGADG